MDFSAYTSKRMLEYFEMITKIPRASYHEEQIASYLCDFASEHGLWYYRDECNNVLIKKAGSVGREDERAVLLQGHTDMVCECDSEISWDTLSTGVDAYIDGDWRSGRAHV